MTRASKHILVLSPTPTHPQDAGNRKRIFEVCDALQKLGGIIHFVYVPREWDRTFPHNHYKSMSQYWDYFHIVAPVQPAVSETNEDYFELDAWWDVGIEYLINWKRLTQKFDMVIANYVFYSKCLTLFSEETLRVLDTHDVMSNRHRMLDNNKIKREFFYTTVDRERAGLERADLILAIKSSEAQYFSELTDKPILVLGHKEPRRFIERDFSGARVMGLIGSANSINRENFERFFIELNSRLPIDIPDFRIELAGHVCMLMDTQPYPFVKWRGPIRDISEFYKSLDLALLPFDFSTGLKIKTIESLSFGLPVIGTANAFDGLQSLVPEHHSSSIGEMADVVLESLLSPKDFNYLADASRRTFDAYTETVDRAMGALYEMAAPDRITKVSTQKFVEFASKDAGSLAFASKAKFWKAASFFDISVESLIRSLRYARHVDYFYDGILDGADKDILYKLGIVDNVHEIFCNQEGSFECPSWAATLIRSPSCQAFVTDDSKFFSLLNGATLPIVMVAMRGLGNSALADIPAVSGFICNQHNVRALMSRYVSPSHVLVSPYLPFKETYSSLKRVNIAGHHHLNIGLSSQPDDWSSDFVRSIGLFLKFGALRLNVFGTEICDIGNLPIAHYSLDHLESFMSELSAYVALPVAPCAPDPIIPNMLLAGIPVIALRELVDLMDLEYTESITIVESVSQAVQEVIALASGGAILHNTLLRDDLLPPVKNWRRDVEKWINSLSVGPRSS